MRYELAVPTFDESELDAMRGVMDSGMYTMGRYVSDFERAFAEYNGVRHAVMVNSGSSANLLMVAAMFYRKEKPLRRGDEVIVPAVSWSTTYFPLYQYGLHIKFVDIDPATLNMDVQALSDAITPRTRAVFAVNLLGNPNDYDAIRRVIADRDIVILEDNCESLGGEYAGRMLGSFGVMGTYSMFFSHHMSTMEGGVVVTDDDELYHILLSLRSHGWTRHLPDNNSLCTKYSDPFDESFRFILPGYNVRPVDMEGAIGLAQLKKLPAMLKARRDNAAYFLSVFGNSDRFSVQRECGLSSWFGFALVINDGGSMRSNVVSKLRAANIDTRPIVAGNFARKEVVRLFDYEVSGTLQNADKVDASGFFVGNHPFDIRDRIDYLRSVIL